MRPPPQPAPVYAPAPPLVIPIYDWSGVYIGVNVGYGWAQATATATAGIITASVSEDLNGPIAGGQVGAQGQWGGFVFGVEIDGQWSDQKKTVAVPAFGITLTDRVAWFATARLRLGAALDRALFYVTGGGGYGEFKSEASAGGFTLSASERRALATAGLGFEYAFTNNLTAKAEYLYLQSADKTSTIFGIPVTTRLHDSIARVGLNVKFGGMGPVAARY